MANQKLYEVNPTETGILKVVWRLDSVGSAGMNANSIPLYIVQRKVIIVGIGGSGTITLNLYVDLSDVPNAPTDFPPSGYVRVSTLGPYNISANTVVIDDIPLYVNFIEPQVSTIAGAFAAYVIAEGSL